MVKFLLIYTLEFLIGLTLITQVIAPMFVKNLDFFWLFKSSKSESAGITTLDELKQRANQNNEEREKIKENLSSAGEVLKEIESKTN